jgi:hypothetical protein
MTTRIDKTQATNTGSDSQPLVALQRVLNEMLHFPRQQKEQVGNHESS